MDKEKIQFIVDIERPKNAKEVQGFMGHCGYYQRFVFQYATISQPLYALIVAYKWTIECEE